MGHERGNAARAYHVRAEHVTRDGLIRYCTTTVGA